MNKMKKKLNQAAIKRTRAMISKIVQASAVINTHARTGKSNWVIANGLTKGMIEEVVNEQVRLIKIKQRGIKIETILSDES